MLTNLLNNNQLQAYFILTFIISWGAILCIVGPNGLPTASEEAKQAMGLGLLLGPPVAAFILTVVLEGSDGFSNLLPQNININLRQIIDSSFEASALLIAPLSSMITLLMLSTFISEEYSPKLFTLSYKSSLVFTGISVGLVIATFEEIGWSGYAVSRLLKSHDALHTGVIMGFIWGFWHFPIFWEEDTFSAGIPLLLLFGRLFTWIIAFRVIMVWVYCRTKGSLKIMILMHASLVFCMIVIEPPLQDSELLKYIISWSISLWLVVWFCPSHILNCTYQKGD